MINVLIFQVPAKPSTEKMKMKDRTYTFCIKLVDYNLYLTKLIDN